MIDISSLEKFFEQSSFISWFVYKEELSSTNYYAKSLDETNLLVITDHQTKGKGRLGRLWESEKDSNLTFSIKLRMHIDLKDIQSINYFFSYFTSVAIEEFLSQHSPTGKNIVTVRWPNDIFINGMKVSGILIENSINKKDIIIGIGINVNQLHFSSEYEYKTTSLSKIIGEKCNITELLINLLTSFDKNFYYLKKGEYFKLFKKWAGKNDIIGTQISLIDSKNNEIRAFVQELLYDGGIKLKIKNEESVFYSGDIRIV